MVLRAELEGAARRDRTCLVLLVEQVRSLDRQRREALSTCAFGRARRRSAREESNLTEGRVSDALLRPGAPRGSCVDCTMSRRSRRARASEALAGVAPARRSVQRSVPARGERRRAERGSNPRARCCRPRSSQRIGSRLARDVRASGAGSGSRTHVIGLEDRGPTAERYLRRRAGTGARGGVGRNRTGDLLDAIEVLS